MSFPGAYLLSILVVCGATGLGVVVRYRAALRGARPVVLAVSLFVAALAWAWDTLALRAGLWAYDPRCLVGLRLGESPLETTLLGAAVAAVLAAWTVGVDAELRRRGASQVDADAATRSHDR